MAGEKPRFLYLKNRSEFLKVFRCFSSYFFSEFLLYKQDGTQILKLKRNTYVSLFIQNFSCHIVFVEYNMTPKVKNHD